MVRALERGVANGNHLGAQVYVSVDGEPVADLAVGEAAPGVAMTPDSVNMWFCCSKPITAVALARLVDNGVLDLDDPVASVIPELAAAGKEAITFRNLLTHTACLAARAGTADPGEDLVLSPAPGVPTKGEVLAAVLDASLKAPPGTRVEYSRIANWFLLAESIERLVGEPFEDHVARAVLRPLGMDDTFFTRSPEGHAALAERRSVLFARLQDQLVPLSYFDGPDMYRRCIPGLGARGPAHDLGRFYEGVLAALQGDTDDGIVSTRAVKELVSAERTGMFDSTYGADIEWGLGFIVDRRPLTGKLAAGPVFGHDALGSSLSFADVERGLVVVFVTNGMLLSSAAQLRSRLVVSAVYRDLGLA